MNYQNIHVNGNRMEPNRIYAGTRGSYITDVSFSFSGEWEGLTKKLIFYPVRGTPVYTVYTYGTVRIPARVMRNAGISVMLISGYKVTEDGKIGEKIITASASVLVESAESDIRNEPDIPEATVFEEIVAKLGAPYIGESGNWYIWDVDTHEFVDTGLPARGEKGETGRGLTILGKYGSLDELRESVKDAQPGDAYAVGEKAPYTIYIWDEVTGDFTNHGDMRGVGITKIEQITDNIGSGEPNTIRIYTDDGEEYDYTVYNGERGQPGNIWIGETEPPDDSYVIWLNPSGVVSGFVASYQGTANAGRALVVGEDGKVVPSDAVSDELAKKMDANNPVAAGSFSMNRKEGTAVGDNSHAEGKNTTASGVASHAEGYDTTASQYYAHAEGTRATASGWASHAEGQDTTASGNYSHAEGTNTTASGFASHTEGSYTTASDDDCHAEGFKTTSSGKYSHSEGVETIAQGWSQHVHGKYNIPDSNDVYANIVGNGESDTQRSNAHTLDWDGNAWYAGDVYVGSTSGTNMDEGSKKLATEEYVDQKTVTDTTLTVEGAAADAKTVGDKLAEKISTPATASVGQTIKVSAVDENGKPTAWEAVDFPKEVWEKINEITVDEVVDAVEITTDHDGNPFSLKKMYIFLTLPKYDYDGATGTGYPAFTINGYRELTYPSSGWENNSLEWTIEAHGNHVVSNFIVWEYNGAHKIFCHKVFWRREDETFYESIHSIKWALSNRKVLAGTKIEIYGVRA